MAELALRTTEWKSQKEKYINWRPVGSTMVVLSDHAVKKKWLEIVCDLVRPDKRNNFKGLPGWQILVDHWTQELWNEWFELNKPASGYPLGVLMEKDHTAIDDMWENSIDPQLPSTLGKEPNGVKFICEVWPWSTNERKRYFVIYNVDATFYELEIYGSFTNQVKGGDIVTSPAAMINYQSEMQLSQETLNKIADPDIEVHPRFDVPVSKLIINSPDPKDMP